MNFSARYAFYAYQGCIYILGTGLCSHIFFGK